MPKSIICTYGRYRDHPIISNPLKMFTVGWIKTGISRGKSIQDRDKILKFKTRQTQDRHIAVKTIQDFHVIKNFDSRQVKNFYFSKFTRQDRSRQDSCQEISRKIQEIANFLLLFGPES